MARQKWAPEDDLTLRQELERANGKASWTAVARNAFPDGKFSKNDCVERWKTLSKPQSQKGPWTTSEDTTLRTLVVKYGCEKWVLIANELGTRSGKQCRERWHNHLDPSINKSEWTPEEDALIKSMYEQIGSKWAEMARYLPGRPDNAIKNHWNASQVREKRAKAKIQARTSAKEAAGSEQDTGSEHEATLPPPMARAGSSTSLAGQRFTPYSRSTRPRSDSVSSISHTGVSSKRNSIISDTSESAIVSPSSLGNFAAVTGLTRPRSSSTYSSRTGGSRPGSQLFSDSFELPQPPIYEDARFPLHEPVNYGPTYITETGETLHPLQHHHQPYGQATDLWHPQPQHPVSRSAVHDYRELHQSVASVAINHPAPVTVFDPYDVSPEHVYPDHGIASGFAAPSEHFEAQQPFLYTHPLSHYDDSRHSYGSVSSDHLPLPPRSASSAPSSAGGSSAGRRGSVVPLSIQSRHLSTLDEQYGDGGPTPRASDFESASTNVNGPAAGSSGDAYTALVSPPYSSPSVTSPQDSGYAASTTFLPIPPPESSAHSPSSTGYPYPLGAHASDFPSGAEGPVYLDAQYYNGSSGSSRPPGPSDLDSLHAYHQAPHPHQHSRHPQSLPYHHSQDPHSLPLSAPTAYDAASPTSSYESSFAPVVSPQDLSRVPYHRHSISSASTSSLGAVSSHPSSPVPPHSNVGAPLAYPQPVHPSPVLGGLAARWEGLKINTDVAAFSSVPRTAASVRGVETDGTSPLVSSSDGTSSIGLAIDEHGRATLPH
ncbi:uncharacterized protein JCM15063_001637 [Sporobolomyces koalae]|uniref:uncharacterized protein n=1 Tax=Sporobolomyces koalae TaxID=500713 RepID=UPI00316F1ED2